MNARYIAMTDSMHTDAVLKMMVALYHEDPSASGPDHRKFPVTLHTLLARPERGQIQLILNDDQLVGYALLIPLWSNEFGGTILLIDELYVIPAARGQGLGRGLFTYIDEQRPFDAIAVVLEISPTNHRARKLYHSLGMEQRINSTLYRRLSSRKTAP